jgi:ubiquitin-like-conjugating enzyme ATG10
LTDLVHTSLFHRFVFDGTEMSDFAASFPSSSFPMLSQGDHPTLGTPCWYLHPCETQSAVDPIMSEVGMAQSEEHWPVRWMEVWFMVVCTTVDL